MSLRTVRFVADTGDTTLPTVNVSATPDSAFEEVLQTTVDSRTFATWQDSGGSYAHLKTVYVADYDPSEA